MPISNYPGGFAHGVAIRGMPVLNTYGGSVFWVDSGDAIANDNNDGTFNKPLATIDGGINKCTANNGDIIMVKAGHTEAVTADGGIAADVAGVSIVGLGKGSDRPTITVSTAAAATVAVSAANVTFHNLVFLGNKNDLVACLEIAGDSCEVSHCEFRESTAGMLNAIVVGKADGDSDYTHIHDCRIYMDEPGVTNVGDAAISILFDSDHITIEDNHIYGDFDLAGIDVPAGGNASDQLVIRRNYIENTATGQHAIQINTGGTMLGGAITDNKLVADTASALVEPHTLQCLGNTGSIGTTGSSGFVAPAGAGDSSLDWRIATKSIAAMGTSHTTAASPVTEFTVTGVIAVLGCFMDIDTAITSTLGTGTLETGVTGSTALLLPQTTADGTDLVANDIWAASGAAPGSAMQFDEPAVINGAGTNIITTVATNNMTAGAGTMYLIWAPISAGANVVSAGT